MRSDLVVSQTTTGGQIVYTIKDPVAGQYFRLREPEYWLIGQFDGVTTPEAAAQLFREKWNLDISAEDVRKFVDTLDRLLFLDNPHAEQATSRAGSSGRPQKSLAERIFFLKLRAFHPGRFLDRLEQIYRPFHRPFWFVVQLIVIAVGLSLLWANSSYFAVRLSELYSVTSIVIIVVSLFILITFHEFAHAVVCRYYGGQVREMGFLLMYFQPCFYCDVSDAWLFSERRHRLAVTFAGPYFQLFLLALAMIVWRLTVPGTAISEVARLIVIVGWVSYLFNFNPLIKLDGYYLLSDWLEIPNLRSKSFAYLKNAFARNLLGWPIDRLPATRRERRVFIGYAVLALAYTGFLIVYILILIGRFLAEKAGTLGLILLFAVLVVIFRRNLAALGRAVVQHVRYMKQILKKPLRLTVYVGLVAVVLIACLAIPFPRRVSGDIVVRPIAEFSLRLNEFGLVENSLRRGGENPETRSSFLQMTTTEMAVLNLVPTVRDGQVVASGDTVAILSSNQLTSELAGAQAELERLQGELALLKAPPKQEEIDEAKAEIRKAEANYEQLQRDARRIEQLVEKGLDTPERLESARSAVDMAKAELENKRSSLNLLTSPPRPEEETVLRHQIERQKAHRDFLAEQSEAQLIVAPINGTVVAQPSSDEILRITDHAEVELQVPVSDFDITLVDVDQPVKVKVRSYPGLTFDGRVVRIPQTAEFYSERSAFPVSVVVNNGRGLLQSGMTGYAKIETGSTSLVSLLGRKLMSLLRVEFWSWW